MRARYITGRNLRRTEKKSAKKSVLDALPVGEYRFILS